jgi:hypothetical protein
MTPRTFLILACLGAVWLGVLGFGFGALEHEEFTPAGSGLVPHDYPGGSPAIQLANDRPTLLLFLHPHCPCSRATLHELDDFQADTAQRADTIVVFTVPPGMPARWEQGDLWDTASKLRGVHVVRDADGVETKRFGVVGSGHALLYGADGRLLFSGGITGSRGHEGDNPGLSAIEQAVATGHSTLTHTPVFGCSLL